MCCSYAHIMQIKQCHCNTLNLPLTEDWTLMNHLQVKPKARASAPCEVQLLKVSHSVLFKADLDNVALFINSKSHHGCLNQGQHLDIKPVARSQALLTLLRRGDENVKHNNKRIIKNLHFISVLYKTPVYSISLCHVTVYFLSP